MTNEEWSTDSSKWITSSSTTFSYYGSDSIVTITMGYVENVLSDSSKMIQYYGGTRIDSMVSKMWQITDWQNVSKYSYTYDGSGNIIMWLLQTSVIGWQNQQRDSIVYVDGHDTLSVIQNWNILSTQWDNYNKNRYAYNGSGDLTTDLYYTWSESAWDSAAKNEYTYDANHNQILDIISQWHTSQWDTTEKIVSVYQAALGAPIGTEIIPKSFELKQNFPNPFNPSTIIEYSLGRRSPVEIDIYNILGQKIKTLENGWQAAGTYETTWDGTDFSGL